MSARVVFVLALGVVAACAVDDGRDEEVQSEASELSLSQHSTWKIDRGAPQTYRVVAYGDSIFAGYMRSLSNVARRAGPYVAGEYLSNAWNANVEVVRRTISGAIANEVYRDAVVADARFMEDPSTRAVYIEMCGNDYLQARKDFERSGGRCDYSVFERALSNCATAMEGSMQKINASATTAKAKVIANLYYPGYDGDNVQARCSDNGVRPNIRDTLLPMMAKSNWKACTLAKRHGFACVDTFAEFMGADYDSNSDGKIDADQLRFDPSESEADYVERVSVRFKSLVKDATKHGLKAGQTVSYIQGDDIHPSYFANAISSGSTGEALPDFAATQIAAGKNPQWNQQGHERLGWALWRVSPPAP